MSEYAGQAHIPASAHARRAHASAVAARDDRDDPIRLAREVSALDAQLRELHRAHDTNDANAWHTTRTQVDRALARVAEDLNRAVAAATPDARPQIVAVCAAYQIASAAAAGLTCAPLAYRTVAREAEITAIASARIDGDAHAGFVDKERALQAELELLSPADSALLAARITRRAPGDAIATAIGRFVPERRMRVLDTLRGAPRRAALARDTVAGPTTIPAAEPVADSPDAEWLTVLGGTRAPDDIARAVDALDADHRHALLARFRGYKPGQGDELAARFAMLDESARGRITTALQAPDVAGQGRVLAAHARGVAAADKLIAYREDLDFKVGNYRFLKVLDELDDLDARAVMLAEFERRTGQSLRGFIAAADWHGKRDAAEALGAIAPARDDAERRTAALSANDRAALSEQARAWATELLSCVRRNDSNTDENAQHIARILGPRTPQEIEAIRAAFRAQGGATIYEELDRSLAKGNEDEAVAALAGDPVHAAAAGLANAGSDTARVAEILRPLTKAQLHELERRDPVISRRVTLAQHEGADRDEVVALFAQDRAGADAAHVANLFRDPLAGASPDWNDPLDDHSKHNFEARAPEHVVAELERMTPAELAAAAAEWDRGVRLRGGPTWDQMIDERFADGDRVTYLRIRALAHGNRPLAKAVALQDALSRSDDHDIEAAIANPGLNSCDPDTRRVAVAERIATDADLRTADLVASNVFSAFAGPTMAGRNVQAQLDTHDKTPAEHVSPGDMVAQLSTLVFDSAATHSEDRAAAQEQHQAASELWQDGELSAVTKIHRAEGGHERAQLIESLDKQQLADVSTESKARYGAAALDEPDRERYALRAHVAQANGDTRPLEDIEYSLARAAMTADELRIENVRQLGPVEDRPPGLQYLADLEIADRQHSWILAGHERARAMSGGALGSESLLENQLAAEGALLAAPDPFGAPIPELAPGATATLSQFDATVHSTHSAADTQHAEKIALGERMARVVTMVGKVAAIAAGQPELYALIDVAAGTSGMLVKYAVEGKDYDATKDFEHLGLDTALDVANIGIAAKLSGTAALAEQTTEQVIAAGASAEAGRAITSRALHTAINLGMSSAATVAHGVVDHQSASDIFHEVVVGGVAYLLPRALRTEAQGLIGDGTRLRAALGRFVGFTTQAASGGALNGGGAEGFVNAAGQAAGEQLHRASVKHGPELAREPTAPDKLHAVRDDVAHSESIAKNARPTTAHDDNYHVLPPDQLAAVVQRARAAGLDVRYIDDDPTSAAVLISMGDDKIMLREERRTGRVPDLEPPADAATVAKRRAQLQQVKAELAVRRAHDQAQFESLPVVRPRHVQLGDGPQGVINQGTQPVARESRDFADRLLLRDPRHPSPMVDRGEQAVGQTPEALHSNELPVASFARVFQERTATHGYATSNELADAGLWALLHAQSNGVDGWPVASFELRGESSTRPWLYPDAPMRQFFETPTGKRVEVYFDAFDDFSGAGTAKLGALASAMSSVDLAAGKADHSVLPGDLAGLHAQVVEGQGTLVLSSSPTGAWAAERFAQGGAHVDLLADMSPRKRDAWAAQIAATGGDPVKLAAVRAEMERAAHTGLAIDRNNKPGTAGDNPNVHVGSGTPISVERQPDGRYRVHTKDIVTGEPLPDQIYDKVVYAYGQSKAEHLETVLGAPPSASRPEGAPPPRMLEPVIEDDDLVGVRVRGTNYQLGGAAAVSEATLAYMSPEDAARARAAAEVRGGAPTFDGRTVSSDSNGVKNGIEIGRNRIERRATAAARTEYRLPGNHVELELGADPSTWDAAIKRFVFDQIPGVPEGQIRVIPRTDGKSGAHVYEVQLGGKPLGMFKVFGNSEAATTERKLLVLLADAKLEKMQIVRERGDIAVTADGHDAGQALLMDKAPGQSLKELAGDVSGAGLEKLETFRKFRSGMGRAATGLGDMHVKFRSDDPTGEIGRAGRKSDADYLLDRLDTRLGPAVGGAAEVGRIRIAATEQLERPFLDAKVDSSAYHGDANIGNFKVDNWDPVNKTWKDCFTYDVGTMKYAFAPGQDLSPAANPKGMRAAAGADLARLIGSVETMFPEGKFTDEELADIRKTTIDAYVDEVRAHGIEVDRTSIETAERWYRFELEVTVARDSDPRIARAAVRRIYTMLGLTPPAQTPEGQHE